MQWSVQGPGAVQWEVIGGEPGAELDLSQFGFDTSGLMDGGGGGGGGETVRYSKGWSGGEQKPSKPPPKVARVMSQNYKEVKAECLKQGALWEDPSFPAVNKTIYYSYDPGFQFKWMRPGVSISMIYIDQVVKDSNGYCCYYETSSLGTLSYSDVGYLIKLERLKALLDKQEMR